MTAASLKKVVKDAVNEALAERLEPAVAEAMEDFYLGQVMDKARKSKPVSREQIMRTLRGKKK